MIRLIENANLILTDSGGLQKEAYFLNKYCITMRDQTEWVELVENGFNKIVGANSNAMVQAFHEFNERPFNKTIQLYGNGNAAQNIVSHIWDLLKQKDLKFQNLSLHLNKI